MVVQRRKKRKFGGKKRKKVKRAKKVMGHQGLQLAYQLVML